MNRDNSNQLFEQANIHLVGGVNSPVRAFKSVGGTPIFFQSGSGSRIIDADGNELVDFIQSWGPLILGHAPQCVTDAVRDAVGVGTSFGAPHQGEIELAKAVKRFFPSMDMVRFVNSGTEAVMSAIRLARGYTKRNLVVKFTGCYHGHVDSLLVSAGSGVATLGIAGSPGIPEQIASTTLVAPLNDEAAVRALFEQYGDDIAAVILEPLPANNGMLVQRQEFLQFLRDICDEHSSLLIFDEVISGFRFSEGGYGAHIGIEADLTTLGKIIGGGLPVGAYGGRSEIMQHLAPLGPVYQAGTLSGNPLAMAAGIATLQELTPELYDRLDTLGAYLESGLNTVLEQADWPMTVVRQGSLFWLSPGSNEAAKAAEDIDSNAAQAYAAIHSKLLEKGVMLAPSAYEIGFISSAHSTEDLDQFITALEEILLGGQ